MSDHYATLGIARTASLQEIKAAYRKLALQWHPDKNPDNPKLAEEKFKEISHAFSILGDEAKRRSYDMGDSEPTQARARPEHHDFTFSNANDIFRAFFGGRDPFAAFGFGMGTGMGMGRPFGSGFGRSMFSGGSIFDDNADDDFFSSPFGGFGSFGRLGSRHSGGGSLFDRLGGFSDLPALSPGSGFQAATFTSFSAGAPNGAMHVEMRSTNSNGDTKFYYKTVKTDANGRKIELEGTDPNQMKEAVRRTASWEPGRVEAGRPSLPERDYDYEPPVSGRPRETLRAASYGGSTDFSDTGVVYGHQRPAVSPSSAYYSETPRTDYGATMDASRGYASTAADYTSRAYGGTTSRGSTAETGTPRTTTTRRVHSPSLSTSGRSIVQGKPRLATSSSSSATRRSTSTTSGTAYPVAGNPRTAMSRTSSRQTFQSKY